MVGFKDTSKHPGLPKQRRQGCSARARRELADLSSLPFSFKSSQISAGLGLFLPLGFPLLGPYIRFEALLVRRARAVPVRASPSLLLLM